MYPIHHKTLSDLEFQEILKHIEHLCITELGKQNTLKIKPLTDKDTIVASLKETSEYLSSFENGNTIDTPYFEPISQELQLLNIENTLIDATGFRKIHLLCKNTFAIVSTLEKFKIYYPQLYRISEKITVEPLILSSIEAVFDKFWDIKNNASSNLMTIRQKIQQIKIKINENFQQTLIHYRNANYLDDITESVIENRRVLAVKAMYRRRVRGSVLGTSKTGSIVFIEPLQTEHLTRELSHLQADEKEEIIRILKILTNTLRLYLSHIEQYQHFLTQMDVISAKAQFAKKIKATLPIISQKKVLFLKEAFHPLLYLNHQKNNKITYPQTIHLHPESRILVISGPNAGGKSITLKTIGLLQIMLQSGMLIPVHPKSECCFFDRILTDIGDNQSIENQLSTYSYRLKNMNYFLKKCNANTLFLIDEFGTGSDPELGGALAETFLEEFYNKEAFGVITTHYTNLKILANELPYIANANMLFDDKTLEPIFRLVIGEAGSSFTFEVAQKNGIPVRLIQRAKKKIEKGKIRFDATIAQLQKERSKMESTLASLKSKEETHHQQAHKLQQLNEKIQQKLSSYQQLYDQHKKMISLGEKVDQMAEKYFKTNKRRPLISEFLHLVQTENAKRQNITHKNTENDNASPKSEKQKQKHIQEEVLKKIQKIRENKERLKQQKKQKELQQKQKMQNTLKVGDRVRIIDSKSVGVIDKIEKEKAVINYGFFTTSVNVEQLELVERTK